MKNIFSPFAQWLCCCFLFIAVMIAARMIYSGNGSYLFMIWNLFLAWIPYLMSIYFKQLNKKKKIIQVFVFMFWLLFFPNALYIVTDIIHVAQTQAAPLWYDAVLLFTSSLLGLALAFASLIKVEIYLAGYFKTRFVNLIIFLLLLVGAYGVYLGRFERWNSWDVLHNISAMLRYVMATFIHPLQFTKIWVVTFLLTGLYSLCWLLLKALSQHLPAKNINISTTQNII